MAGIGRDGLPTPEERVRRRAVYVELLPRLQLIGWQMGYNMLAHGSMTRDLDVVAVPWIDAAASADALVAAVANEVGAGAWTAKPSVKPHGRRAYSVHFGSYENAHLYVDLSVMPR